MADDPAELGDVRPGARRPPARRRADPHGQRAADIRRRAHRRQRLLGLRLRRHRPARRRDPHHGLRLLDGSAGPDRAARLGRRDRRRRHRRRRRSGEAGARHPAVRAQLGDRDHRRMPPFRGARVQNPRLGAIDGPDRPARRQPGLRRETGESSFTYQLYYAEDDNPARRPARSTTSTPRVHASGCSCRSTRACSAWRCSPSATTTTACGRTSRRSTPRCRRRVARRRRGDVRGPDDGGNHGGDHGAATTTAPTTTSA